MNRAAASGPTHSEFRGRKRLIASAALGLTTGMTATMFYSLGAFVPLLQAEFGWNRGNISLAVTIMTLGLFLSGPAVGRLCDRHGAALIGSLSLLLYATAVAMMAMLIDGRIEFFWAAYGLIAVLGAGATPIALLRPITASFQARRGLALGLVLTGAGIAGFWVPNLVTMVSESWGWRAAYLALAASAALVAPCVWFGFRSVEAPTARLADPTLAVQGMSLQQACRTPQYWLLMLMAMAMALGVAGIVLHLVPLFLDLGSSARTAAQLASLIGISSVIGRIAIGLLLDRYAPSQVSMSMLALAMLGILLLWQFGLQYAAPAVILLGFAAGAEIDLLSYLTARHFGQKAFGAIYGWQYSVFALGYGFSPFLVGYVRDASGSYAPAMLGCAALMAVSAWAARKLGRSVDLQTSGQRSGAQQTRPR